MPAATDEKKKTGSVELVAKSMFKRGGVAKLNDEGFPIAGKFEQAPEFVEPGHKFTATAEEAEQFILMGVAARPEDYAAEQRAGESPTEKVERLRRELAEAEGATSDAGRAHLQNQREETAAVEKARAAEPKEAPPTEAEAEGEKAKTNLEETQPGAQPAAKAGAKSGKKD